MIATAVDIAACAFTDALLDELVQEARSLPDAFVGSFNVLHRSLLARWRDASTHREMTWQGQGTTCPAPAVWAYFQAYATFDYDHGSV